MFTLHSSRLRITIIALIAFAIGIAIVVYTLPSFKRVHMYQKPAQVYDYYYIYAEEDGRELMRVPIAINVDDELITEDNKRYRVIRIDGDRGTARYVEDVNIQEYAPKNKEAGG